MFTIREIRSYTCTAVKDADAALAAIETFKPDVVILDWFFRDNSGVGLSTRLRAGSESFGRPLVVVVVSAQNEPADFRTRESVDEYLVKPVPVDEIARAIDHLGRR